VIRELEGDKYPTQSIIQVCMFLMLGRIDQLLLDSQDPLFQAVLVGFKKELQAINDTLPDETLIALVIDPRFKDLYCLPQEKHESAWQALYAQYLMLAPIDIQPIQKITIIEAKKPELLSLLEDYQQQKKQKTQHVSIPKLDEFKVYRALLLSDIDISSDPLKWWKQKEQEFPTLARIARIYLSIPASQATCERSFSLSGRICSDARTSLTPEHVEMMTMLKKNHQLDLVEYETAEEEAKIIQSRKDEGIAQHPEIIPLEDHVDSTQDIIGNNTSNSNRSIEMEIDVPKIQTKSPNTLIRQLQPMNPAFNYPLSNYTPFKPISNYNNSYNNYNNYNNYNYIFL